MRFLLQILILCTVMNSCALFRQKKTVEVDEEKAPDVATWVYAPSEYCEQKNQVCATGEGATQEVSDSRALTALAAIFETKIDSKLSIFNSSLSEEEQHSVVEFVQEEINQNVKAILKGAIISERSSDQGLNYSLATLDKGQTTKLMRAELENLDGQLMHYYQLKRKSLILKLHVLLTQRELLNEKIMIVSGNGLAAPLKYSQIEDLKYQREGKSRLKVQYEKNFPKTIRPWFEKELTQLGFVVLKEGPVDYLLKGAISVKEEFINVKGFKKYSYNIFINTFDTMEKKIGGLSVNKVGTGRNQTDIFIKLKAQLQNEIRQNISQLNLD